MQISPVGSARAASNVVTDRGLGSLKSADFFRILVTELQNQDPFEPTRTADMISQVSQIRSIELSGKLTDTLDSLAHQQRINGVSQLIGKYVQAISRAEDGSEIVREGVVTGVRFDAQGLAVLELDTGEVVPAGDVVRVTTLDQIEAAEASA